MCLNLPYRHTRMEKLSHEEIVRRQSLQCARPPLAFAVILNNIRSLYNVGSVFRTADGVGLEKITLCGITGCPPAPQIAKTALGAETRVPWEHYPDAPTAIHAYKTKGYQIVLLEQMRESVPYQEFLPQPPVCLVVGNEISGVSDAAVSLCDAAVEIEMAGIKNSLNVSVAFGVVAYHFRQCLIARAARS